MEFLTGLVSHWAQDEVSGSALDLHGSNVLTDVNTVGSTSGLIDAGRFYTASANEYFNRASNASLQTGNIQFVISAWARLGTKTGVNQSIVSKWGGTAGTWEYILYFNHSANRWSFAVTPDGSSFSGNVNADNYGAVPVGAWCHVVGWHDSVADQVGISVDAGTPNTASYAAGVYVGTADFRLGANGAVSYFNGTLDEISFWKNRIFSSGERSGLFNGGAGLPYSAYAGAGRSRRRRGGGPGPLGR